MTDATEAAPAAPEVKTETAPVEQQSTDQAELQSAEQAEPSQEDATEEPAASDSGNDSAEETPKKKSKGGFQKRIDELTTARIQAEMRAQQFQRELEAERAKKAQSTPDDLGPEPMPENFTTIQDWMKAHKEWAKKEGAQEERQKFKEETEQQRKERETKQRELEAQTIRAAYLVREAAARQKHPDFDATVTPFAPIIMQHPAMSEYVMREEMGAEMAFHLGRNPAILDEISRMNSYQAGRELLKLEAKLSAPPPAKPLTKAAPPITPVGARANAVKTIADLAESDDASAYIAKMNERLKRKA